MMMNGELAGFTIPRLGMGTMALAIEGRPDRNTAIRTIHAGLDAGVRYLDTAWSYYLPSEPGTGTAKDLGYGEKLVRDALASWNGPRDEVLVATKTGYRRTMEVPAFVAPASDSGESDKQGAGFGVQMSDSPESDTEVAEEEDSGATVRWLPIFLPESRINLRVTAISPAFFGNRPSCTYGQSIPFAPISCMVADLRPPKSNVTSCDRSACTFATPRTLRNAAISPSVNPAVDNT